MRKRFCYLRDGCILLFCYIKFDMKFDHLTPQIINKGFLIVLFQFLTKEENISNLDL